MEPDYEKPILMVSWGVNESAPVKGTDAQLVLVAMGVPEELPIFAVNFYEPTEEEEAKMRGMGEIGGMGMTGAGGVQ
jgi:hypothetical protein